MKARDWMNNNSALVTIAAVVLLVISLGVIIMQTRGPGSVRAIDLYFYDLNTGKLFVAKSDHIPPIKAPSGPFGEQGLPGGVRAHVFSCGECGDFTGMTAEQVVQAGGYIAYLEMYTPQGKAALTADPSDPNAAPMMIDPMEQTLVKPVDGDQWMSMYSERGYRMTDAAMQQCPDGSPGQACRP